MTTNERELNLSEDGTMDAAVAADLALDAVAAAMTDGTFTWIVDDAGNRYAIIAPASAAGPGIPGEKCMSDDFEVRAYTGRIVGADTVPAPQPGEHA